MAETLALTSAEVVLRKLHSAIAKELGIDVVRPREKKRTDTES